MAWRIWPPGWYKRSPACDPLPSPPQHAIHLLLGEGKPVGSPSYNTGLPPGGSTRVPCGPLAINVFTRPDQVNRGQSPALSLIHISEPTRLGMISYAVFC